ncbi:protein toll-like isoform X2 [Pectinophora gossypiella]|nr:protein toll-like isoform X2 [Pectinophora gossypiella]
MRNLTHLDMSRNRLTGWSLFDLVKQLPSLRYLNLDGNQFVNLFCNFETRISSFTSHTTSLEWLSLQNMPMDVECLSTAYFSNLRYLNLSMKKNSQWFSLKDLPKTNATNLEVDLRGLSVYHMLPFSGRTHQNLLQGNMEDLWGMSHGYNTNVTVWLTAIDCDCENYWFVRCLRELPHLFSFPDLQCSNSGVGVLLEPRDNIDCRKSIQERNCVERHIGTEGRDSPNWGIAKVDCHTGMKSEKLYPEYNSNYIQTVSLNVSGDGVTTLKYMKLGNNLKVLDLRNNQIARLDANDSSRLFALPERRVWMSGNILICDCENKPLLDALHEHSDQVVDYDALTCIDTGLPLSSVTSFDVCQVGLRVALAICGVLALLLLVAAVYLWRNRLRLKVYLYSRGLCLFCLREEDVDSDKPYDAFLSFAHGDMEYVNEVLLPELEAEPHSYRVCVHYRDWPVGDWIPAQIMRSVSLSKRTIILLSRNFIASIWASLEFRYAMASATKEGRTRLIVLIMDDVLSEALDAEMQGYLNYNTYLSCDDPWFWDKLRYAMPHRKREPVAPVFNHTPGFEQIFMEPLTGTSHSH